MDREGKMKGRKERDGRRGGGRGGNIEGKGYIGKRKGGDLRGGRRIRKSGEKGACREGKVGKRSGAENE